VGVVRESSKEIVRPAELPWGEPAFRAWLEDEFARALAEGYRRVHFRDHNQIARFRVDWRLSFEDVPDAERIPPVAPSRVGRPHRNPRRPRATAVTP
jgi:hypothetical protein